jgi:hypothetical protein
VRSLTVPPQNLRKICRNIAGQRCAGSNSSASVRNRRKQSLILPKYAAIVFAFPCPLLIFRFTVRRCPVCCTAPSGSDGRVVTASWPKSPIPIRV